MNSAAYLLIPSPGFNNSLWLHSKSTCIRLTGCRVSDAEDWLAGDPCEKEQSVLIGRGKGISDQFRHCYDSMIWKDLNSGGLKKHLFHGLVEAL